MPPSTVDVGLAELDCQVANMERNAERLEAALRDWQSALDHPDLSEFRGELYYHLTRLSSTLFNCRLICDIGSFGERNMLIAKNSWPLL